jgi:single-stranded-DNA-specific exonuclease
MLPTTRWKLIEKKKEIESLLVQELGIHPIVSRILINREIFSPHEAKKYLHPSLKDLHNPFLMKDIEKGVNRLIRAISQKEKIVIYGDYDVDGITSIVCLMKFMGEICKDVTYYIPSRIDEGYSLNKNAIDRFRDENISLIITVDCGISDRDEIDYAKSLGIDTIILDHHEVPAIVPDAFAVINPNQKDCFFPFKYLAGVGIVFNFLIALRSMLRKMGFWEGKAYPNLKEYLDLVALGTIGDISPLVGDNRIFAKIGLDLINEGKRIGTKALKDTSGLSNNIIDSGTASFSLIPKINAAGRVGSPEEAVRLLMTDNMAEALEIASSLDQYNRERQKMEKVIFNEIIRKITEKHDFSKKGAFVFASSDWHPGVIGIVASRIVDRFYRPTILISLKEGIGKGSGRSIAEFNLYAGLKTCDSLLLSFGGHRYAAGISIKEEDIEKLGYHLDQMIKESLDLSELVPSTVIDAQCDLRDINHELITQFEMLAPFGSMNPEPVICARNVQASSPTVVGNNHLRMRIYGNGVSCNSIWFNKGYIITRLSEKPIDIVFTPQLNYWNGSSSITLKLRDVAIQGN